METRVLEFSIMYNVLSIMYKISKLRILKNIPIIFPLAGGIKGGI